MCILGASTFPLAYCVLRVNQVTMIVMKRLPSFIITAFLICTCGLLALDSFTNTEKTRTLIGLSSYQFVIPVLLIHILARIRKKAFVLPPVAFILFNIALPVLALLTLMLTLLDWSLPVNLLYSYTKVHPEQLGLLTLFIFLTSLINQSKAWWKANRATCIRLLPYGFFSIALLVRMWPFNFFSNW